MEHSAASSNQNFDFWCISCSGCGSYISKLTVNDATSTMHIVPEPKRMMQICRGIKTGPFRRRRDREA